MIKKIIKKIMLNTLSLLFCLIPRNKHTWVTGKVVSWEYTNSPPAFFDNSKYFYLYLVNNTKEKVYWLSCSDREIQMLQQMNLPVVRFPSIKGIWLVLRAKFFFHHYGPDQINPILQRGSVQLDFWHGTPLKKIRYDVIDKPEEKYNIIVKWQRRGGAEYVFSTSSFLTEKILMQAFAVPKGKILGFGYPRMDVMGLGKKDNLEFCRRYSAELVRYIEISEKYDKVMLYMPTYRDDDPEYFEKAEIDFEKMSLKLREINGVFFLKLHPLTKYINVKNFDNIIQISNDVDIYPFLVYTDFLVTDYSSIFFDYLMLDKEIIFIPYDYDNYVKHRELYFDYNEITPGIKYHSFKEFVDNIYRIDRLDYRIERERVKNLMIDDYCYDACEKTYNFIREHY